jgi:Holliday junction resolvase RusA-like endonuclease
MPIPKNTKNPEEWIGKYVDKVPDLDNLTKFYKDVGTGILYHDDKQIVKISALKVYNTYIGTTIRLQEMRQERYDR